MEFLVKVIAKGEVTNIQGANGVIAKVEIEMGNGEHRFIASAFDKAALSVAATQYDPNALYVADLTFGVSKSEKKFQNIRLNRINPF